MNARTAAVLGFFLVVAAVVHGGIYTAGHDFVVNRFTGAFEFVPAGEGEDEDVRTPLRTGKLCLKHSRAAATTVALQSRR
ncbi:MAG: hypothetical protein U0807_04090 [Candidatus Binatia bacterium]